MKHQKENSSANTTPMPVVTVSPVTLPAPGRVVDIQMRIAAPVEGNHLPLILMSHGHGSSNHLSSLNGDLPIIDYWAAHGFVVIQPTHLSSKSLHLEPDTPGFPFFWQSRVEDMKTILDNLDYIEDNIPQIKGRIDRSRIAVAGLSLGAHTASMLLGARLTDPENGTVYNLSDSRIKAGILFSALGNGKDLNESTAKLLPFFAGIDFTEMTTSTLVVWGDKDKPWQTDERGADWHADPYYLSNGPKSLLTVFGGEHLLGGLSGYDAAETSDENPERVTMIQQLTTAYLHSALIQDDTSWQEASKAFMGDDNPMGKVESK